jgi:hypothetical protein
MYKLGVTAKDFQMLQNNDITSQNILFVRNSFSGVHASCTRIGTVSWFFDSPLTYI